jgi:N-ethylmaleimide reductase
MPNLFSPTQLGNLTLQNHIVMAPMTRCRAPGNVPSDLMATYYGQRSGAGLVITEGVSPSPNGLGYVNIPGIFSAEQIAAWKPVTAALHAGGAKAFMQLMHCGRVAHPLNLPAGARMVAPSAVTAKGQMFTIAQGMQDQPAPEAMSEADLAAAREEFVQAAKTAVAAGFDGVELHSANGYLLEQFIRPNSNVRTDPYGGGIEGRARFVLEVVDATIAAIGKERVGIRLSPLGVFNDMPVYEGIEADYLWLARQLGQRGLTYLHIVDHSASGAPPVPDALKIGLRDAFGGPVILVGAYTPERAQADLDSGKASLIAVGKAFISNPDLVQRWKTGAALNAFDANTFYSGGAPGYTDYPAMA